MLVVLYFHTFDYSPFEVAMLFLFYEIFGIVTNLLGGWLGDRLGIKLTLYGGIALQILALLMLTPMNGDWTIALAVPYVMMAQALSGIAKDLTKMSSKSAIRLVIMSVGLFVVLLSSRWLPTGVGKIRDKVKFRQLLSKSPEI